MLEDPKSYVNDLIDYFNIEFGDKPSSQKPLFTAEDFVFAGEFEINGIPTLIWRVKGETICATVSAFQGGVMLGMDEWPK